MSHEGIALVSRATLVILLIIVASVFRALAGPGRRRNNYMLAGTVGGMSFGVAVANGISRWIETDVSVICACLGMVLGWTVALFLARHVPREAN